MTTIQAVAIQVTRPLNPASKEEFRTPVTVVPTREYMPIDAPTLRDAVLAAHQFVLDSESGRDAVGLAQTEDGYRLLRLASPANGSPYGKPLVFDGHTSGDPVGTTYTDRFERVPGINLRAIVGSEGFAAWGDGYEGAVTALATLAGGKPAA